MAPHLRWLVVSSVVLLLTLGLTSACHRCPDRNEDKAEKERGQTTQYVTQSTQDPADKTWLFAVSGRKRPYNFMDERGNLVGFDIDLISEVCSLVNKKCKFVLAEFTECTITERDINYAGRGLMSGWFDGCPGYVTSVDRTGAFDFTLPYLSTASTFTVAPGNPSGFDPDVADYSSFTLVQLTGAVTNAKCLGRLNKTFNKILIAANLPEARELLLNGTADALFSPRTKIEGLQVLPQRFHCDEGGAAVMLKKGGALGQWFNPAFKTFVLNGGYRGLCATARIKYNTNITCLASPNTDAALTFKSDDPKVWLFSASGRRKPFNYLDDDGRLTGFDVDFVQKVCQVAGRNCATVLTQFTECTFTNRNINYPGRGLMDGWVDACTGYGNTLDREAAFDFTDAYLRSSSFYSVAPGNPSGFDPAQADFSNFTITHLTGAYTNAKCLARQGKSFNKIIIAANLPEAKELLLSGKADVLFSPRSRIPDLESLPLEVHCERTGTSVMVKKGSDLPTWWNPAFRTFVQSGEYTTFCTESRLKYAYPIKCISEADVLANSSA